MRTAKQINNSQIDQIELPPNFGEGQDKCIPNIFCNRTCEICQSCRTQIEQETAQKIRDWIGKNLDSGITEEMWTDFWSKLTTA